MGAAGSGVLAGRNIGHSRQVFMMLIVRSWLGADTDVFLDVGAEASGWPGCTHSHTTTLSGHQNQKSDETLRNQTVCAGVRRFTGE